MKRAILPLVMMAVALGSASGMALAATVVGTDKAETLMGTRYADYVRAGGRGEDRLYGGEGDDRIVSQDLNDYGIGQRDTVDCGPGHDTVIGDFDDGAIRNCEEGVFGGF